MDGLILLNQGLILLDQGLVLLDQGLAQVRGLPRLVLEGRQHVVLHVHLVPDLLLGPGPHEPAQHFPVPLREVLLQDVQQVRIRTGRTALVEHLQQPLQLGPPAVLEAVDLDHDGIVGERLHERIGDQHLLAGGHVQVVPVRP